MRALRLDFVPDERWLSVWLTATSCVAVCLVALAWGTLQMQPDRRGIASAREEIALQKADLDRTKAMAAEAAANTASRAESEKIAVLLLRRDWNTPFRIIESLNVPGARLVQFQLDGRSGQAQLEYELDTFVHGSDVTAKLNLISVEPSMIGEIMLPKVRSSQLDRAWQLERLSAGAFGSSGQSKARGLWIGRLGVDR